MSDVSEAASMRARERTQSRTQNRKVHEGSSKASSKTAWTKALAGLLSARTLLLIATAVLVAYGVVMTYSVTSVTQTDAESAGTGLASIASSVTGDLLQNLAFLALSLLVALGLSRVPSELFTRGWALVVLVVVTAIMLAVTLVAGSTAYGAVRWIRIGPVGFQPSELAKVTLVLVWARVLVELDRDRDNWAKFLPSLAAVVALGLLTLAQKDLGTLIIIFFTLWCMALTVESISPKWLIVVLVAAAIVGAIFVLSQSYRMGRIAAWLGDIFNDSSLSSSEGYQLKHGIYALGTGGLWGSGLGTSRLKYGYLTQADNDFIFAIIGEELGLLRGTLPVILCFALFGWAGMRIAREATTLPDRLVAVGLTCAIVIQAFVNIGGVIKLIPETGRTLPFVSSGGSSLLISLAMVGILLAIDRRSRQLDASSRARRARRGFSVVSGGLSSENENREGRS